MRNGYAVAAQTRRASTFKHRSAHRGGAKNDMRDIMSQADEDLSIMKEVDMIDSEESLCYG